MLSGRTGHLALSSRPPPSSPDPRTHAGRTYDLTDPAVPTLTGHPATALAELFRVESTGR